MGETAVAIALILGAFSNLSYLIGGLLSPPSSGPPPRALVALTWPGPPTSAGIMYPITFAGLFLASAGLYLGLDSKLRTKLSRCLRWTTSTCPCQL